MYFPNKKKITNYLFMFFELYTYTTLLAFILYFSVFKEISLVYSTTSILNKSTIELINYYTKTVYKNNTEIYCISKSELIYFENQR